MWKNAISKLKIHPFEHNVVLAESEMHTESDVEKMEEIMFEEFRTPALYIGNESAFSLIWHRKPTGVIVDCGDYITSVVPFYDGTRLPNNRLLNYGGRNVTLKLFKNLSRNGYHELDSKNPKHFEELRKIKEKFGYVQIWERRRWTDKHNKPFIVPCELVPEKVSYLWKYV